MTAPGDELPALDEEPRDGVYRHLEDAPPTMEEITAGQELGQSIDVDDDTDTGL